MRWDSDEMRARASIQGHPETVVTRPLCRSWESRGWARVVPLGRGRVILEVEPEAMPE